MRNAEFGIRNCQTCRIGLVPRQFSVKYCHSWFCPRTGPTNPWSQNSGRVAPGRFHKSNSDNRLQHCRGNELGEFWDRVNSRWPKTRRVGPKLCQEQGSRTRETVASRSPFESAAVPKLCPSALHPHCPTLGVKFLQRSGRNWENSVLRFDAPRSYARQSVD